MEDDQQHGIDGVLNNFDFKNEINNTLNLKLFTFTK
jgi:hypothetical protein